MHVAYSTEAVIIKACKHGHLGVLKYFHSLNNSMIDSLSDIHIPMQYACYNGHLKVVKYLISIGQDFKDEHIDAACKGNKYEVRDDLISIRNERQPKRQKLV